MRLRKLLVPVVVVALGVSACGGDDSPSADETPTGSETGDETPDDDAGSAADSQDSGSSEESADQVDTGADGEEVDAVELFTVIADATVAEGSYEFEATMGDTTTAGAIRTGASLHESDMRIMSQAGGLETTVLIVDGRFFLARTEDMGPPAEGSWMMIDPESNDPFAPERLIRLERLIGDVRGPNLAAAMGEIASVSDQLADLTESADMLTVAGPGPRR